MRRVRVGSSTVSCWSVRCEVQPRRAHSLLLGTLLPTAHCPRLFACSHMPWIPSSALDTVCGHLKPAHHHLLSATITRITSHSLCCNAPPLRSVAPWCLSSQQPLYTTMSRFFFLTLLSLLLSAALPSASAFSLGSGTCYATADAVTRGTGKHPITPQLGFYLGGLPTQYDLGATYSLTIMNTQNNPNITYAPSHHTQLHSIRRLLLPAHSPCADC